MAINPGGGGALIALGFVFIRPDEYFPGFWALLPVVGAALLINAGFKAGLNRRVLSLRPVVWLGLISYPLYLWHWALLWLAVVVFGTEASLNQLRLYKLLALILSFVLAQLTYRFLEQPLRRRGASTATVVLMMGVALAGLAGLAIYAMQGARDRPFALVSAQAGNYLASIVRTPLQQACFDLAKGPSLPEQWFCTLGDPEAKTWIAAYGDSHALSVLPALDKYGRTHSVRVVFGGLSGCPPLLGTHPDRPTGDACVALSHRMAQQVKTDGASAVVLIVRWGYYTGGTTRPNELQPIRSLPNKKGQTGFASSTGLVALTQGLDMTLRYYSSLGVPVVIVEDNPQQQVPLLKGIGRFDMNLTDANINAHAVTLAEHQRNQHDVNQVIQKLAAKYATVTTVNTDGLLCGSGICPWVKDGQFLYYDDDHLSIAGSRVLYPLISERLNRIVTVDGILPK